jgi:hypothetical protein
MNDKLTIIDSLDSEVFQKNIEILWKLQDFQSPNHLPMVTKYNFERLKERGDVSDSSFLILMGDKPVVGFLGLIVKESNILDVPSITLINKKLFNQKHEKAFLKKFDSKISEICGDIWYRDFVFNGSISFLSNYLLKLDAIPNFLFSHVLDLDKDESVLKRAIRKSYKSLINWGLRELKPQIYSSSNITWEKMLEFRKLHIHEAGRETRSEASWRYQLEMIQEKEAFATFGYFDGELVSSGLFMYSNNNCFYAVSASRGDKFNKPLFHAVMWTAILYAKEIGCKWFEVGEQLYPNHPAETPPTKKELGISHFKEGFGGEIRMFLDLKLESKL